MTKRKKCIVIVLVLIAFIVGIVIMVIQNKNNSPDVRTFVVSDYQYYIESFPSEENLGSISNAKDAAIKAETIWIKTYGKCVKKEKPYQIFYDAQNEVWLIQGSLRSNMMGGVANILIENDTGKVLAVWHEK